MLAFHHMCESAERTMTVSKEDALSALHDVETAERRSRTMFGYGKASPHLLL